MTTAHKPTFHPAVGTSNQGGYRFHQPRQQQCARDLNAHTAMKVRGVGQNSESEVAARDLKAELLQREKEHEEQLLLEKRRKGLVEDTSVEKEQLLITDADLEKFDDADDSDSSGGTSSSGDDDDDEE